MWDQTAIIKRLKNVLVFLTEEEFRIKWGIERETFVGFKVLEYPVIFFLLFVSRCFLCLNPWIALFNWVGGWTGGDGSFSASGFFVGSISSSLSVEDFMGGEVGCGWEDSPIGRAKGWGSTALLSAGRRMYHFSLMNACSICSREAPGNMVGCEGASNCSSGRSDGMTFLFPKCNWDSGVLVLGTIPPVEDGRAGL